MPEQSVLCKSQVVELLHDHLLKMCLTDDGDGDGKDDVPHLKEKFLYYIGDMNNIDQTVIKIIILPIYTYLDKCATNMICIS